MMALGAVSIYLDPARNVVAEAALLTITFAAVGFPCLFAWIGFGVGIRRFLSRPNALTIFNITMAVLLVASALPMLL
jgi:threonine/homoserine/homoserine lactone efflux protein